MTTNEKALMLHEKWRGKLETVSKTPVKTREDLSLAYTPGVAEPCKVIAENAEAAYTYTWKSNTVAVVSDGKAAVLGLEISAPMPPCPLWRGKRYCSKNLAASTPCPSVLTHRIPRKS